MCRCPSCRSIRSVGQKKLSSPTKKWGEPTTPRRRPSAQSARTPRRASGRGGSDGEVDPQAVEHGGVADVLTSSKSASRTARLARSPTSEPARVRVVHQIEGGKRRGREPARVEAAEQIRRRPGAAGPRSARRRGRRRAVRRSRARAARPERGARGRSARTAQRRWTNRLIPTWAYGHQMSANTSTTGAAPMAAVTTWLSRGGPAPQVEGSGGRSPRPARCEPSGASARRSSTAGPGRGGAAPPRRRSPHGHGP